MNGPYTVAVQKGNQAVASQNTTIPFGQAFTPTIWNVGPGSGEFQWCVGGYTNFDGGGSSYTGTNLGTSPGNSSGARWTSSWTPPAVGTYIFYIAADGNSSYNPVNPGFSQPYILTVTTAPPPTSVTISPPSATVTAGSSVSFNASGGLEGYVWGGAASGGGSSTTATFPNLGVYNVTVYSPAGGGYSQSNTAVATVTVNPDSQFVSIAPGNATVTAGNNVTFIASGGQEGYVWGGAASGSGGTNSVLFPSAGTYNVSVYSPAGGVFAQSNIAVAAVTVLSPTYTLTVNAGPGGTASGSASGLAGNATPTISATPNSGYTFVAWTGDTPVNPTAASTTIAMNNANRTVAANFAALQTQTITFNPPATALDPGPAIVLSATASSGLPVSFSVLGGPASLSGNTLSFTGRGTVTVQALQGGGMNNGVYYQAAPSVSRTIQINAPFTIIRLRFNSPAIVNGKSTGNTTVDAQNIGHSAAGKGQASFIWTDPAGLQSSPWPTFNNPAAVSVGNSLLVLPSIPAAAQGSANSVPTGYH